MVGGKVPIRSTTPQAAFPLNLTFSSREKELTIPTGKSRTMKILITGIAGRVGTNVARKFLKNGHDVSWFVWPRRPPGRQDEGDRS